MRAVNIDAADITRIVAAFGSLGGGFAFCKPFAERAFNSWLSRADKRAEAEAAREAAGLEKERALSQIAALHERTVGVLENVLDRLNRIDARQDRVEAHLGIPMTVSAIPSPVPPPPTLRQPTDPGGYRAAPQPAPPSSQVAAPAR